MAMSERCAQARIKRQGDGSQDMSVAAGSAVHQPREDVRAALKGMSQAEWIRLRRIADVLTRSKATSVNDLIQETSARVLGDTRP